MKAQLINCTTAVFLFFMPTVHFGQAPDLGAAYNFVAFTAVGAFEVFGTSTVVTGDVGTNVGAFAGFPPGTLIGQIHVADEVSAAAAPDVLAAYAYLASITCGLVKTTPLGNGEILAPNVYCIGSAATLNGDLTLDGQGDPDALFIFQINGAFATSTLTNVFLINSASLCNVYWQVNGEFTLGEGSVFRGNLIAEGAIHLLEGSSLIGRALSTAGAIDLHNNIVTIGLQPEALVLTGSTICVSPGGNGTITSSTSVIGVNYQLYDAGDATVQSAKAGTGAGLTWLNLAAGTGYYVIATNSETCSAISSTADITTYANPTITTDGTIEAECYSISDQTTTLDYSATTNSPTSYSIDWNAAANAAGLADQIGTLFTFLTGGGTLTGIVISAGTVAGGPYAGIMTLTNDDGCTVTQAVSVTIDPLPIASVISADGPTTICDADSVILSGNIGGIWNTGETTPSITVKTSGDYYVTNTNDCGSVDSNHITVTTDDCGISPAIPISIWALVLGGTLIAVYVFIRYRRSV